MNAFQHNFDSLQLEPLPVDCSPALREIDSQLRDLATGSHAPLGLSERVFLASVRELPVAQPRLRLVGGGSSLWMRRATWSRLAMAASLALALGVAMQLVQSQQNAINMAQNDARATELEVALALRPLSDSTSQLECNVSPLLDMIDLDSSDPVIQELASMVQAIEG